MSERNEGIALLRPILTLSVIMIHFCDWDNTKLSYWLQEFSSVSVPVYMLISFCLTESVFSLSNREKFKYRIRRL